VIFKTYDKARQEKDETLAQYVAANRELTKLKEEEKVTTSRLIIRIT
jgi:hypothetical protein